MSNELGEFLRARRAEAPVDSAVTATGRRRVPGLRREEVAAASGISVDYYIRLEQGRERHPSDAVLDALARVLGLPADARTHLDELRDAPVVSRAETPDQELFTRMHALTEAVSPNPAYVLDRLSNVVAANAQGLALYDGFSDMAPGDRNTCRYLLTDPRAPEIFVEWEELARGAVAHLRAANAARLGDPDLRELVDELTARSPVFAEWWASHIVERRRGSIKHLRTPDGIIARRYEVLHVPDEELRMTLWLPQR